MTTEKQNMDMRLRTIATQLGFYGVEDLLLVCRAVCDANYTMVRRDTKGMRRVNERLDAVLTGISPGYALATPAERGEGE